jgi:ABC-type antimicrobial peptide transport system permease subunit
MFLSYLMVVVRNLRKQKGYSVINLSGLAIGMACCILILLWVQDELSYDRFHENADDLYVATFSNGGTATPFALAGALEDGYPEIIRAARYTGGWRLKLAHGERSFMEEGGALADPSFFEMFAVRFIHGDAGDVFADPHSIVISEEMALKYFGADNPIGKIITIDNEVDYKVTGVFEDFPKNSHLRFSYIRPIVLFAEWGRDLTKWEPNTVSTYVQLHSRIPSTSVDEKISDLVERHRPQDTRALSLRPVTRLHLHRFEGGGPIIYVYIFSGMAVLVLIIACFNFMSLATARFTSRAKEVGLRKAIGANRSDLIAQFYVETSLWTLVALLGALTLVELLLPVMNGLSGKELQVGSLLRLPVILGITGVAVLTFVVSGTYPALFLSAFSPAKVLRGPLRKGPLRSSFRDVLMLVQFAVSIFMIVGTAVIYNQIEHLKGRELGFDKENIVHIYSGDALRGRIESVKRRLLQHPGVIGVTATNVPPVWRETNAGAGDVHWEGQRAGQRVPVHVMAVDYDYLETFRMEMVAGRFLSRDYSMDAAEGFVVNEAAVRAMGMDTPVGKRFSVWDYEGRIVGVIKDFHFRSLHDAIEPLAMKILPEWNDNLCVRLGAADPASALGFLEDTWNEVVPGFPFEYRFLDESLDGLYRAEERVGEITRYFTILALFVSSLGLIGLASHMAERRTKEIGVRKVLGSSVTGVVFLLSKVFVKRVLSAAVIAWPIAWYAAGRWLENYPYRVGVGWGTFVFAGLLVLAVALSTVSYQVLRAATSNPVEALRYE